MSRLIMLVLVALASLGLVIPVRALPLLDQQYDPTSTDPTSASAIGPGGLRGAQALIVGITGRLLDIDLLLGPLTPFEKAPRPEWLIVEIQTRASDGLPSESILLSSAVHRSQISATEHWQSINLDVGLSVKAGQVLALVLRAELGDGALGSKYKWRAEDSGDPYTAGARYFDFTDSGWSEIAGDYGFRTYVEPVPEPTTSILVMLGVSVLLLQRKLISRRCLGVAVNELHRPQRTARHRKLSVTTLAKEATVGAQPR